MGLPLKPKHLASIRKQICIERQLVTLAIAIVALGSSQAFCSSSKQKHKEQGDSFDPASPMGTSPTTSRRNTKKGTAKFVAVISPFNTKQYGLYRIGELVWFPRCGIGSKHSAIVPYEGQERLECTEANGTILVNGKVRGLIYPGVTYIEKRTIEKGGIQARNVFGFLEAKRALTIRRMRNGQGNLSLISWRHVSSSDRRLVAELKKPRYRDLSVHVEISPLEMSVILPLVGQVSHLHIAFTYKELRRKSTKPKREIGSVQVQRIVSSLRSSKSLYVEIDARESLLLAKIITLPNLVGLKVIGYTGKQFTRYAISTSRLQDLRLVVSGTSPIRIIDLKRLRALRRLTVTADYDTEVDLSGIELVRNLEHIELSPRRVIGLRSLCSLSRLISVDLTTFDRERFDESVFSCMSSLVYLNLRNANLSRRAIKSLTHLKELIELTISGKVLQNTDLIWFGGMHRLKKLHIPDAAVTRTSVRNLKMVNRNLKLVTHLDGR